MTLSPTNPVDEAVQLWRAGRREEAQRICETLAAQAIPDAMALTVLAEIYGATGERDKARACLQKLTALCPNDAAAHRRLGDAQLAVGARSEAAAAYREALRLEPNNARCHNNLGLAHLHLAQAHQAIQCFETAIALQPNYAIACHNLGLALSESGEYERAVASYVRALELNSTFAEPYLHLGKALQHLGRDEEAVGSYEQYLRLQPGSLEARQHRDKALARLARAEGKRLTLSLVAEGAALSQQMRVTQALELFGRALRRDPDCAEALIGAISAFLKMSRPREALDLCNRALQTHSGLVEVQANCAAVYLALKRPKEALAHSEHALRLQPGVYQVHFNEAEALRALQQHERALEAYDRALALQPGFAPAHCGRGQTCREMGDARAARESYRRALEIDPNNAVARTGLAFSALPVLPVEDETDRSRSVFETELARLDGWLAAHDSLNEVAVANITTPFYLAYQERPNKELLTRCGSLYTRLMKQWASRRIPAHSTEPPPSRSDGRVHLGIVTAHLREHSVFRALVKGWVERLDKTRVRISVLHLGLALDSTPELVRAHCELLECGDRTLEECVQQIRAGHFDALLYCEVGMDPLALQLASLRLAPHQIVAWGHPETSGLATMDYYLSAECFEPPDSQQYYSERLIALPGVGCYYEPLGVVAAAVDFAALGIKPDVPLFLCPGTPYKYAPEHDHVLVEIARELPRCQIVLFEGRPRTLSARVLERLRARFRAHGLDPDQYLVMAPWLSQEAFFGLMRRADVCLDTLGFSGFNTVMQAIECQLPIVAYEGRFMRGRFASGLLRRMGLDELVANSHAEYVRLAVRLVSDREFQKTVRALLGQRQGVLYREQAAIDGLLEFVTGLARLS